MHFIENTVILCYTETAVEPFQQEGGEGMEYLLRFLVAVMASVVGYYIRKWLDRNDKKDS